MRLTLEAISAKQRKAAVPTSCTPKPRDKIGYAAKVYG